MKAEGDAGDGMMTDAEMTYLEAMEQVKVISKQLVIAERSFNLVRERIEQLVARYEELLVRIENESIATASVLTYDESSYDSDEYDSEEDYSSEEDREKEKFQRRAQRAELRAELAAREAILAKQEARKIKVEKQREIDALQQRLTELQSESSQAMTEKEHSFVIARAIAANAPVGDGQSSHGGNNSPQSNAEKINGVKQRFRDRMADRLKAKANTSVCSDSVSSALAARRDRRSAPPSARSLQRRQVGEEMFQHLDFYERSLKAVGTN